MASYSSSFLASQSPHPWTYDIFISFRGEDTRRSFSSHLYDALCRKALLTFIDDHELQRGEEIAPSLVQAIQDYESLSNSIFEYADGIPLALKVLGSSLNGKRTEEWESALNKLSKVPNKNIQDVLQIGYSVRSNDYGKELRFSQVFRLIDLRYSRQLIETPQLSATNLECLIVVGCDRLSEASLPFHFMSKLKLLNVKHCTRLKSVPGVIDMKDRQIFNFFGRLKFPEFPEILSNLKELYLSGTELEELPQSIVFLTIGAENLSF